MKVDELCFFIIIFWFFVTFILSARHIFLSQKCLYAMGLSKHKSVFMSNLTGEGMGFQHTQWISQMLSNRMEIPKDIQPLVDKMKYNYKLIKLSFLIWFIFVALMFVAHYYQWKI